MCLNLKRHISQQGSAMAVALFVVIVIGGLLLGLSRQQQLAAQQQGVEVQGARAFWAAQAGLQLATSQLFPLDQSASSCAAVSPTITFSAAGLAGCRATLTCQSTAHPDQASRPLYRLRSSGVCPGDNEWQSSRVVELEVY